MAIGDEDEVQQPGAEEVSTSSEGTERPEGGDGQEDPELSADDADDPTDDGEPEGQEVDEPVERPTRGSARFQRLANETKEARERAERAEREVQELRRAQLARDHVLSEREEAERLALMTPEERANHRITKFEREALQREQQREFRLQNEVDRAKFEAKATLNPVYAKYQDEVEERFQSLASKGQATEREVILKFILGERALSGAAASTRKAQVAGKKRVEAQRVSNGSAKGDTKSQRGKTGSTPEERLKGVFI